MKYEFNFGWFIGGLFIVIASVVFLRFHRQIADNMGSCIADYEKYRLYGLISIGVGFICMTNIAPLLLGIVLDMLFKGGNK